MDDRVETGWPSGWYPDPVHRFEFRWFNGQRWTADVSVDGRRFVDDGSIVAHARTHTGPVAGRPSPASGPSRTLAILALIFGAGGLLIAWVPFLFVVGGGCAIAAIVLGSVALRRVKAGRAAGKRMAIGGIASAVAALALCSVGAILTAAVVDDFEDYVDAGPNRVTIETCTADADGFDVGGTIRNRDDVIHDYVIVVRVDNGALIQTRPRIRVDEVAPDRTQAWEYHSSVSGFDVDDLQCELVAVHGPNPFDIGSD
jgi:hypothetical protein